MGDRPPAPTPLEALIRADIAERGPIDVGRYMALCLGHGAHGYYTTQASIGAAGDFITAPEISQIFGELLGLWIAQSWCDAGRPSPALFCELGPGRGVMMADAWRAAARMPGFREATELWLVETSPRLRDAQAARLAAAGAAPRFASDLSALPEAPLFLLANEFFDALPVRQFRRVGPEWRERRVDAPPGGAGLCFVEAPARPEDAAAAAARWPGAPDGAWLEIGAAGEAVAAEIGRRLAAAGGAALLVDYGYDAAARRAAGGRETLQALGGGRSADPLAAPGAADLTAHVDFSALSAALTAGGAPAVFGPVAQGALLRSLGAEPRAAALARAAPEQEGAIAAALRRLMHPGEMGVLFKAVAATSGAAPAGFETKPPSEDP